MSVYSTVILDLTQCLCYVYSQSGDFRLHPVVYVCSQQASPGPHPIVYVMSVHRKVILDPTQWSVLCLCTASWYYTSPSDLVYVSPNRSVYVCPQKGDIRPHPMVYVMSVHSTVTLDLTQLFMLCLFTARWYLTSPNGLCYICAQQGDIRPHPMVCVMSMHSKSILDFTQRFSLCLCTARWY